jgi:activator of HSP90 ATPase
MTKTIQQSEKFNASPEVLYEMYMDSKLHTKATGMPARLGRKSGAGFKAFGGMIEGKTLQLVPGKMIVQAWRSSAWKQADGDSILILTFQKEGSGGRVDLAHVNVPPHDHKGVTNGWKKYYWKPWRAYLKATAAS